MWSVMMTGMMLPSAAPTILLFARSVRSGSPVQAPIARTYAFAAGYLLAWTAFSLAATALQLVLSEAMLISPMMEVGSPTLGATILIAAGLYQWTPIKRTCLSRCRSPLHWLSRHWRPGVPGAVRMGVSHGLYCVGCCWALMASLFALGVMSVVWMAFIAGVIAFEKLITSHRAATAGTAALLLVLGMLMLVAPDVIPALTTPGSGTMSEMDHLGP
jgi:predicted metal-binding membrane protein